MNQAMQLLDKMEPHLLRSKVSTKRLSRLRGNLKVYNDALITKFSRLMQDIELHEYREVQEIWQLIPETQWQSYEAFDIEGLREQLLLTAALKNLRLIFIKGVLDAQETRSETTSETAS